MTPGENRIKIVGFDCKNIDLKMFFEISQRKIEIMGLYFSILDELFSSDSIMDE